MPMLIRTTSLASQLDLASANASYLVTVNAFNGSSAFTASPFVFAIDTSFQRTQVAFANHKGQTQGCCTLDTNHGAYAFSSG